MEAFYREGEKKVMVMVLGIEGLAGLVAIILLSTSDWWERLVRAVEGRLDYGLRENSDHNDHARGREMLHRFILSWRGRQSLFEMDVSL